MNSDSELGSGAVTWFLLFVTREPLGLSGLERGHARPCLPWLLLTLYHVQLPALSALQVQADTVHHEEGRVDVPLSVCMSGHEMLLLEADTSKQHRRSHWGCNVRVSLHQAALSTSRVLQLQLSSMVTLSALNKLYDLQGPRLVSCLGEAIPTGP